jgi:PEP-CTERM motif
MRLQAVAVLGLLGVAGVQAGTIVPVEVGQLSGSTNLGLTTAYVTSGCMAGVGNCVAGSTGGYVETNYDTRLFANAVNSGATPTTPVPFSGYVSSGQEPAAQLGGSGAPQFAMISDSAVSGGDFWNGQNFGSANSLVVPIGLSNVNDVALMLSNVWGVAGAQDTTLTFNFGTASNGGINDTIILNLVNSGQGGSSASGELQSGVDCASMQCGVHGLANGSVLPSGTIAEGSGSTSAGTLVGFNTYNLAKNLFGASLGDAYTSIPAGTYSTYGAGNLSLGAIDFNFGALGGLLNPSGSEYLVDVQVTENDARGNYSQTAISAITVDTVSPEPSTVFLFLSGLGAIGFARFRRKKVV